MSDGRDESQWTPEVMPDEGARDAGQAAPQRSGTTEELEELKRQLDDKQDRLLRALAEVDNVKRRTQRERDEYVRYANESLIRELLPALSRLDAANLAGLTGAQRVGGEAHVAQGGRQPDPGNPVPQ